jgi:hypothetical protein
MDKLQTRDLRTQDLILHTSRDIENFWERWDQAKRTQRTTMVSQKIQSALLGLAVGGLIITFTEPGPLEILSVMLILFSGLLGAITTINILRRKRASCCQGFRASCYIRESYDPADF